MSHTVARKVRSQDALVFYAEVKAALRHVPFAGAYFKEVGWKSYVSVQYSESRSDFSATWAVIENLLSPSPTLYRCN